MNKQALIIVSFLIVAVFLVWQYFLPSFDQAMAWRADKNSWEEKLSDTQGLRQRLEELKNKYEGLAEEAERVTQAVTSTEDQPGLLAQLEQLSSQNGLILDGVTFVSGSDKEKKAAAVPSGVKTLRVEASLSGTHSALRSFLKALENNLRIMDVLAINFGEADLDRGGGLTFKVSSNTYYRE